MVHQEPEKELADEVKAEEDTGKLNQALAEEKAEKYLANWQRAQADFINYKRRCEQEKGEIGQFANTQILLSLLPILDDFDRAFDAIPENIAEQSWVEGIKLVERKLVSNLETQGLKCYKAAGEPFDPMVHEAIKQDRGKDGIVVREVQKGYKFHDRVIRPSKVIVGNGEEENNAEIKTENNS